jgi:GTPase-activating protein BEM2
MSLDSSKRSSQVMYHSSFINKLAEFSPPTPYHPVSLAKGWKPYKLELKGTKLCFYKPSSDRTLAIKELFPIELTGEEDEVLEIVPTPVEETHTGGRKRDDTFGRRKRAYWGRATHPDLVVDHASGKVKRGNLEALVHESAFATTTLRSTSSSEPPSQSELETRTKIWHDFASAVVLCLPLLADRQAFETEFQRCCTNLINGASDEIKDAERGRVAWLIAEYMRFHGPPLHQDWDEWKKEILPLQDEAYLITTWAPSSALMPKSSSTRALHTLTPQLGSLSTMTSPNLGTFSPRPDATSRGVFSLADTLGLPSPHSPVTMSSSASSVHSVASGSSSMRNYSHVWDILEDEGLTKDVLMMLEPNLIALSLRRFHQCAISRLPESMTIETLLGTSWPPAPKGAVNDKNSSNDKDAAVSEIDALFGSDERPHWLTRIVLHQILSPESPSSSTRNKYPVSPSGGGAAGEDIHGSTSAVSLAATPAVPTSRTHSRSELISAWTRVGEMCRLYGDECSWQAIVAALCSRPVARLEKSWKRVDVPALKTVQSWVASIPGKGGDRISMVSVQEPRLTVWGGKTRTRLVELLEEAVAAASSSSSLSSDQPGDAVLVSPMMDVKDLFEGLRTSFDLCPRLPPGDKEIVAPGCRPEDVLQLAQFWNSESTRPGRGNVAKFTQ